MAAGETFRMYVVCVLEQDGEDHTDDLTRIHEAMERHVPGYDDCAEARWTGTLMELATLTRARTPRPLEPGEAGHP